MIVRELLAKLGLDVDQAGFASAEKAFQSLTKNAYGFGLAAAGGLAVLAAGFAKFTADAGDATRKLAQRTGVDSIALQEFAYAADLADVSTEQLAKSMQFLAKNGTKDVRKELLRLADHLQKMPEDGDRVAYAIKHLGKEGAKLIPMLSGGSRELAAMAEEAHLLGIVMSEEDQKASEDFNDEMSRLIKTFVGIRNVIGLALIRPLTKAATAFRQMILQFRAWKPNTERVTMALKGLAFVIGGILTAAIIANSAAVAWAVSMYAALGIGAVLAGAKAVIAWIAAAAPIVAAGIAIGLVIAVLEDLYQFLTGGESVIGDFVDYVMNQFGSWPAFFQALVDWVAYLWGNLWDNVKSLGHAAFEAIKDVFKQILSYVFAKSMDFAKIIYDAVGAIPGGQFLLNQIGKAGLSVAHTFGGGASPQTAIAAGVNVPKAPTVLAPNFQAQIEVHAAPGMDPKEVAGHAVTAADEWWNSKMRETASGVE